METFTGNDLLEPIDIYKDRLKDAFHDNAVKKFEEMTKKAQTNIDANQAFCKVYYDEMEIIARLRKSRNWRIFFLVMLFIIMTAATVAGVLFIFKGGEWGIPNNILFGILGIVLSVILVLPVVIIIKKIVMLQSEIDERQEKADKAKQDAFNELISLYNLYEYNMAASLMTATTPLIQLDQTFDGEKYQFLHEKYDYSSYQGNDMSTVFVQSGSILGNPFIFEKYYVQSMRDHRYSGTLTITWTERVSDGKGNYHTETRTQTLTAYYTAPEPYYFLDTWLIYGNEAAPKLSFSRQPTNINNMSDRQIESYIKSFDKKLDKLVAKDLKNSEKNFTRMDNDEFEALFGALDRDNEVEFRLLFTPLAQKNMIKLLRNKDVGFGDDFIFKKRKCLNYVKSAHQQYSDSLDKDPNSLKHFDYKEAEKLFINYCDKYLKDVFFDLAPLISIPLYQQHKTIEYIYQNKFNHNVTQDEAESAANSHNIRQFMHPNTRSDGVILKSKFINQTGDSDYCEITAHSFEGFDRVEYVPVLGGDGHYHNVPVHWVEYSPISRVTPLVVKDTKQDKSEFDASYKSGGFDELLKKFNASDDIIYKKRIFSFIPKDNK